jgi:hypothetical protein
MVPQWEETANKLIRRMSLILVFCAYFSCVGWILSALRELNRWGYGAATLLGIVLLCVWCRNRPGPLRPRVGLRKFQRRFRRPLPFVFLLVAALAILGGLLYAPNNYDALAYRLPRMLNWLSDGKWAWIRTADERLNYSTAGWEWIAMPFLQLFRTDRLLFLINVLGFLLLPGLLFSVFRQSGVPRRVAWTWMWILPLAYGYAMQAGSIENDLTGGVFCLMAVHFSLRARRSNRVEDVWLAGLAAALVTASKLSNLPLLLPCLIAVWPALPLLRRRWRAGLGVAGAALLISAAPTVVLNQINTGCWNGDPENLTRIQLKSPTAGLLGNGLLLLEQSFMPPVLPNAHKINAWLDQHLPVAWNRLLKEQFPRYQAQLNELPQEENSGLGIGVTLLLLTAVGAAMVRFRLNRQVRKIASPALWVGMGTWVAFLVFITRMGSELDPRILLPYYPLMALPLLALPGQNRLARNNAWRRLALLASLSVVPAVILTPARPLWPAVTVSEWLAQRRPDQAWLRRMATVYACYAKRHDLLAPFRNALPAGVREVGFVAGGDDIDYSLWYPLGDRRVIYLRNDRRQPLVLPAGVEWVVIKQDAWDEVSSVPLKEWIARNKAVVVLSASIMSRVGAGDEAWCLVRLPLPARPDAG